MNNSTTSNTIAMLVCFILVCGAIGHWRSHYIPHAQAASPIDNIHLENWADQYRKYDKSRKPDQEWDETTYGTAFGNHLDAMQDGYDPRTVQQAAVVVIWEAIAATELYHHRREVE